MNKHLKSAVERDKRKVKNLISPICQNDAEVIHELIQALSKLKEEKSKDLKTIIENWKYLKDEVVAELLLQFNIENPIIDNETEEDEDSLKNKRKFIDFDGQIIEVSLIKTVGIEDYYDFSKNKQQYKIVINKDLEEKYMLTNGVFIYFSQEQREKKFKQLKSKLKDFIKII